MLGRSQRSGSRDQSLGPHPARVPNAAGNCLRHSPPPATLQSLLQALRQVLSWPRRGLSKPGQLFPPAPEDPDALAAPGLQKREWDAASSPNRPKFLPRGSRRPLQVCCGWRTAARPVRRGGRRGGGRGSGGLGGGGAGARGLGATFLQTTLPHAESTEISGASEGIASEGAGGDRGTTQVSPARALALAGAAAGAAALPPAPRDPHGGSPNPTLPAA